MSTIATAIACTGSSPKISSNRIDVEAIKRRAQPILFEILLDLFEEVRQTDGYLILPKLKVKVSRQTGACWDLDNPHWRNPIPGSDIIWLWERYLKPDIKKDHVLPPSYWREAVQCFVAYLDQNEAKFSREKPDLEAEDRAAKKLLFAVAFRDKATKKARGTAAKFAKMKQEYLEDPKKTQLVHDTRQSVDIRELCAEMRNRLLNWSVSEDQHLFTVKRKERANRNVDYTLTRTRVKFPDPLLEMLEKRKLEEENAQKRREKWALDEEEDNHKCDERSHNLLKASTSETSKEQDRPKSL